MRGLLVRVGIDQTYGGWNAPCRADGSFCYVPMQPQNAEVFDSVLMTTYDEYEKACQAFGVIFPNWLHQTCCHLDPDFSFLTYGDGGRRARRISQFFEGSTDNFIAFYASFTSIDDNQGPLIYAIIGLYRFQNIQLANQVPPELRNQNAHTRVAGYRSRDNTDLVVFAHQNVSGRLRSCIPIGERRSNRQYYVREELFQQWGGISSRNGWIQRSVYLPHFCQPERFLQWFNDQNPELVAQNII
jgi:hypothetical protein